MTEFVTVVADDLARAWLDTILDVAAQPDQKAFHVVTRIRNSGDDGEQRIHHAASDLLVRLDRQPVDTVANTIFPAAMARQTPDVDALAARYENLYPQLRRLDSQNRYGTYFHRLVAYPGPNGPVNQLAKVIGNLTSELANRSPKRARYEVSLETPGEAGDGTDETLAPDGRLSLPVVSLVPARWDESACGGALPLPVPARARAGQLPRNRTAATLRRRASRIGAWHVDGGRGARLRRSAEEAHPRPTSGVSRLAGRRRGYQRGDCPVSSRAVTPGSSRTSRQRRA
jgi:hypothetical protein